MEPQPPCRSARAPRPTSPTPGSSHTPFIPWIQRQSRGSGRQSRAGTAKMKTMEGMAPPPFFRTWNGWDMESHRARPIVGVRPHGDGWGSGSRRSSWALSPWSCAKGPWRCSTWDCRTPATIRSSASARSIPCSSAIDPATASRSPDRVELFSPGFLRRAEALEWLPHLLPGRFDGPGTAVRHRDVVHHLAEAGPGVGRPEPIVGGGQLRRRLLRQLSPGADPRGGARHQPDLIIVYTGQNEFLEDRTYHHIKQRPAMSSPSRMRWCSRFRFYNVLRNGLTRHRSAGGRNRCSQ